MITCLEITSLLKFPLEITTDYLLMAVDYPGYLIFYGGTHYVNYRTFNFSFARSKRTLITNTNVLPNGNNWISTNTGMSNQLKRKNATNKLPKDNNESMEKRRPTSHATWVMATIAQIGAPLPRKCKFCREHSKEGVGQQCTNWKSTVTTTSEYSMSLIGHHNQQYHLKAIPLTI